MKLTRGFAFFSVMTMWSLTMSEIPIIAEITAFAFPLLILVSGWRYALYFLGITILADLPDYVQVFGFFASEIKTAIDISNSGVGSVNIQLPSVQIPSYAPQIMQYANPIVSLVLLVAIFWGLPTYIRIIRRVKRLTAFRNYRRYS